jgi:hypothetical protein
MGISEPYFNYMSIPWFVHYFIEILYPRRDLS